MSVLVNTKFICDVCGKTENHEVEVIFNKNKPGKFSRTLPGEWVLFTQNDSRYVMADSVACSNKCLMKG